MLLPMPIMMDAKILCTISCKIFTSSYNEVVVVNEVMAYDIKNIKIYIHAKAKLMWPAHSPRYYSIFIIVPTLLSAQSL